MGYSFDKVCRNTLPKGTYKLQITDIDFKTSGTKDTGHDMVIRLTVVEGTMAKKTLVDTIYENAFGFRLKPFLKAAGVDTSREFASAVELYNYGIKEAKGKIVMAEIDTRTYNGNEYNNIKSYAPVAGSTTSVDDVIAEFATDPNLTKEAPKVTDLPDVKNEDSDEATPFDEIFGTEDPLK